MKPPKLKCIIHKITNNHLAKLVLGAPRRNAKLQLGLWMGCSLLDITLRPLLIFAKMRIAAV